MIRKHLPAIHVAHHKNTMNLPVEAMPIPAKVCIAMVQHIGAPCKPVVKVGDSVKVGQVIGDSEAFVSAPIHASVSGKVAKIERKMTLQGQHDETITIIPDKLQEVYEGVQPPVIESRADFLKAVRASGLVGLGGAAFPTHVKFNPKNIDEVDTLIVNGAECEPYITVDYRRMLDEPQKVINGCLAVMKWMDLKKCFIGVESNKPKAIKALEEAAKDYPEIEVITLQAKYPQGAERVLIYETTGKVMGPGKLPADVGVVVSNVTSIATLQEYLETGMPLVAKNLTVDGNAVRTPKNLRVPIGTVISDVVDYCGGYRRIPKKLIMGGPMMGRAIYDDGHSILKNNNAILVFDEKASEQPKATDCIRCGRCVEACPMNLMPTELARAVDAKNVDALVKRRVGLCMECGSCSYVCPAKRQLSLINRLGKAIVAEGGKKA
ncbi:MAG: electron transport complex subunit RsxC [Clostridiales bacterium]|nr:electron transport complex subunit RsxC [Clostridiales bacterium]